jgi:hypothetical protein
MEKKCGSFAKLAHTFSEMLAADTTSNLSFRGKKEKLFINKMDGRRKWTIVNNEVGRKDRSHR